MTIKVTWNDVEVFAEVTSALQHVNKSIAKKIESKAKQLIKQKAKQTTAGGLLDQFSIEKKKTSYRVWCQGPKKWRKPYHAKFFELGTKKDDPHPFMRPAAESMARTAESEYKIAIKSL